MLESCNVGNFNFQYFNFSTFQLFNGFNTLFMCSAVFSTVFNSFQQTMLKTCFQHQTKHPPAFLLNFDDSRMKYNPLESFKGVRYYCQSDRRQLRPFFVNLHNLYFNT